MSAVGKVTADIKVADEVWIAMALLHREHPGAADFSSREIEARLVREGIAGRKRPGVAPHISSHCVANRRKDTGSYRLLFETGKARRRLFRPGDPYDPSREGGKMVPDRDDIPTAYHGLLEWYARTWARAEVEDPLLALAARHRKMWKSVDPDAYVRELREGFE